MNRVAARCVRLALSAATSSVIMGIASNPAMRLFGLSSSIPIPTGSAHAGSQLTDPASNALGSLRTLPVSAGYFD